MNFAFQIAILIGLLAVCCFTPGFFVVRRLQLSPLEKLCASIGLSVILLYLYTWIVFVAERNGAGSLPSTPFVISSAVCLVLGLAAWKDIARLVRSFRVKHALTGFGFLVIWTLVMLGMIRVYSGGDWSGDWQEHFQRTLFFLQRLPTNTAFADMYSLPARPPMMNVLATFFLAQTQDRFEFFQVVFTFLNLSVFFACCLLLPAVAGARRTRVLPLVFLFALNPVFMQSVTYSWTRALTAFFVISGIALYLRAWRKSDLFRMVVAFVFLAAGLLVHYSAGPYVVFLTLHYVLWLFWKRPQKWKEFALIATACSVLLATWFAWSVSVYGNATFTSNTTVGATQGYEGSNLVKVAANLLDSIVPPAPRDPSLISNLEQPNTMGRIRDFVFLLYQPNIVFGMGLIGGPAVLWLVFRRLRLKSKKGANERTFWLAFIIVSTLVGAAAVGSRATLGVAHGTMLSLELIGLTFLASRIQTRSTLMFLVLAGCVVDFSIGILLHAHVQNMENDGGKSHFAELEFANNRIQHADAGPVALSSVAWQNWFEKHRWALSNRWLKDLPERYKDDRNFQVVWPLSRTEILGLKNQDAMQWGGWYSRHNGELTYFGDHVAGAWGEIVPASLLLVLAGGLIATFILQTRPSPRVAAHKPAQSAQRNAKSKSKSR